MLKYLSKIYLLLALKEKKHLFCLMPGIVFMDILNIVGIAFVLPFLELAVK